MKSMTKKVVALSATFAMAASFAASAATISGVTATANSADDITVTYTHDIAADGQATILVYEGETPFAGGTGDNVGYINQDAATGSFNFAMRDSLRPADGAQKSYNVKIGGTDVAIAGTADFKLGTAAPAGFTATFEDDGVAVGEAIKGTEITLPEITNNKTATRYYTGWTKDGGTTVLAPGAKVTLDADTKFTAVHFGKGDVNRDSFVDATDADFVLYYDGWFRDEILEAGCPQFWSDDDENYVWTIADVDSDSFVDSSDADYILYYDGWFRDEYLETGKPQFWED